MRIQRSNFLLTLQVKHTGNIVVSAYGSNFEPLSVECTGDKINILTYMPNRVMLVLSQNPMELVTMSLAGIKINKDILPNLIEYKPNVSAQPNTAIQDYLNNPSTRSNMWDQAGCVIFDLFNLNPFAYHMYIGNQIQF